MKRFFIVVWIFFLTTLTLLYMYIYIVRFLNAVKRKRNPHLTLKGIYMRLGYNAYYMYFTINMHPNRTYMFHKYYYNHTHYIHSTLVSLTEFSAIVRVITLHLMMRNWRVFAAGYTYNTWCLIMFGYTSTDRGLDYIHILWQPKYCFGLYMRYESESQSSEALKMHDNPCHVHICVVRAVSMGQTTSEHAIRECEMKIDYLLCMVVNPCNVCSQRLYYIHFNLVGV